MAAITGNLPFSMRFSVSRPKVRKAREFSGSPKSFSSRRSPPAQKAFGPSPPKMMTRASSSASALSKALFKAVKTFVETAFTGGLASMMVTTWPCLSYLTSSDMASVHLDVGVADHLAPELGLGIHARGELRHRAAGLHEALLQQLVLHVLGVEDVEDRLVEQRHDRIRRRRRRHQENPGGEVHVRQPCLLESRHVGRVRVALVRGDAEHAHLAGLH